jgi:hypothetical protein
MIKGPAYVDMSNFGAGMRAPNVGCMGNTGEREVIDEMTALGQQHSVFRALDRLTDPFSFAAHFTLPSAAATRTARTILT